MDNSTASARPRSAGTGKRKETVSSAVEPESPITSKGYTSVQDRVFAAILKQVLPKQDPSEFFAKSDERLKKTLERPNFSLPIMSSNFRRFNARIGIAFVFQGQLARLFSWEYPSHTLSFLAVYTFCCLNPFLITIVPLVAGLFFIMVPAFYARHPPPPNPQLLDTYAGQGPAYAPPATIKPAQDVSKAFFRNMRDLQNSMEDFSAVYDQVVNAIVPVANFSDERLSSTIFISVFFTACLLFVTSFVLPWKVVFLASGWIGIGAAHPSVVVFIRTIDTSSLKRALKQVHARLQQWMLEDIVLDEAPEKREVEVFELQRQIAASNEWDQWMYSTSAYDPQSPPRISGDRPRGTRFFEDVQPPRGWEWSDKKWTLDLLSQEWVEERMITAVEVETDGERWVYDLDKSALSSDKIGPSIAKEQDQEDDTNHSKGEWRRRRWVRVVRRKALGDAAAAKILQ